MAEEAIKLPGSSYDEVKKISVLYTNVGKQAPLGEIARSAKGNKSKLLHSEPGLGGRLNIAVRRQLCLCCLLLHRLSCRKRKPDV